MHGVHALQGVAGFVEAPTFYPYLTGRRNLELLAAFDGGDARDADRPGARDGRARRPRQDRVGGYSHGMRQRLGIAGGAAARPEAAAARRAGHRTRPGRHARHALLIRRLADQGMTVLLSSHLLTEVEEVCNRVAIVRTGRIVYEGEIADLKRGAGTSYRLETTDDERALAVCRAQRGIGDVRRAAVARSSSPPTRRPSPSCRRRWSRPAR